MIRLPFVRRLPLAVIAMLVTTTPAFSAATQATPTLRASTITPAASPQPLPSSTANVPTTDKIIQFAWFSRKPTNLSLYELAQRYHIFIFTRKEEYVRDLLRSYGVKTPILHYMRLDAIQDPGSCSERPSGNNAAYRPGDFCEISAHHPDWFLLDEAGQRISTSTNYYYMNLNSLGWREFYVARANEMHTKFGWDGIFMDNAISGTEITRADMLNFMTYVQTHYEGLIYANTGGLSKEYQGAYDAPLDGVLHEAWSLGWKSQYLSPSTWQTHLTRAEQAQNEGLNLILVAQGSSEDSEKLVFSLASYLLIANGRASFRYGSQYREAIRYPNVQALGQPNGRRYAVGSAWQRDFENGYVTVDPSKHIAIIHIVTSSGPQTIINKPARSPTPTPTDRYALDAFSLIQSHSLPANGGK
jgi:hypothetical protein